MKIRTETSNDIDSIATLTYQAFENHPHHEPGAKPTEHLIVERLRNQQALSLSLVAEDESGIIGHIALSPVMINGEQSNWFGLGPVSVKPTRQNEGIGKQLINQAMAMMLEQNADGVVLLGEPEYYGRFGFNVDSKLTLADVPAEYFLVKRLTDNTDCGQVTYHPGFYG
ncbi:GNAT family N-acetyltransferase [Shewanella pneumatophori]|uniref:N-acetyltransferase n=1 Tax=Shewanella pneumatophori TaxID=314092 RepID=A0A9X1ZHF8_9GAMM|nr:N-acetyltransferase [Shewanella pneumatophori]MCL1137893.1 N-acetyltransferase [Shewanella pneumatophori]